jgi:two-component system, cell cycle sensor histidine kinase and response regulator CckA
LQINEERLLLAQSGAGLGLWEYDVRTGDMHSGIGWSALYGLPADAPSLSYDDWLNTVVYPDDRESVRGVVQDALAGHRSLDVEFRVTWPDGEVHWLAARGRVVRDEVGTPLRVLGVAFDVTDRRDAEDRLRQAERMEVVGQLAGGVAHEANNQMTVVLGAAEFVLRRSDLPDVVREDVQNMRAAAERTANITAQLLAFSRRQVLQPRSFEVDEALEGIAGVVRRALGPLSTLVLHLRAGDARVSADPGQFAQVVLNLALNAADAMPLGGIFSIDTQTIELTEAYTRAHAGVRIAPGPYVLCSVSDTGHGMTPATQRRVFEPFFTTKPVGKGTGLGLATVYGIVKQSGGYIWVYSEPGHGTTFKLYLPLEASPTARQSDVVPAPHGAGETVLVVDDDASVRDVTVRALQNHGFVAIGAAAAGEALDVLGRMDGALRLVVTDVLMPGVDGAELARRVRQIRPDLPVLFVSGYTDDEVVRRGLVDAGQPFLQKPFTPEALARRVSDLLEQTNPSDGT